MSEPATRAREREPRIRTELRDVLISTPVDRELLTHLVVREDAHLLYGFASAAERATFRQLIRIAGVGPRTALAILSGLSVSELAQAVSRQDGARLVKVPGIGKKTAERLVLELKDRLPRPQVAAAVLGGGAPDTPSDVRDDVISALVNLGYHRPLAEKAVDAAIKTIGTASDASFEHTLKTALRELAK